MATESEFEAVVSEADIEAGVLPMSGNIATPAPAPSDKIQPTSSGFNLLNFSGLQQVCVFSFSEFSTSISPQMTSLIV